MENGKHIKVLTLQFDTEIGAWEVPLFRGAVLSSIGKDVDILFHNHAEDDKFRYSYPLIQYKRLGGKAAIVCVEEGVDSIGQFLSCTENELKLGERSVEIHVEAVVPKQDLVQPLDQMQRYHLSRWLPLNSNNYQMFLETRGLVDRVEMLQKVLVGNILSFAKGIGLTITDTIRCSIIRLSEPRLIRIKNQQVMSFDLEFSANISLPDNIGLGKHASLGCGVIKAFHT